MSTKERLRQAVAEFKPMVFGKNFRAVGDPTEFLLISYATVVARYHIAAPAWEVTDRWYSRSTTAHINLIRQALAFHKVPYNETMYFHWTPASIAHSLRYSIRLKDRPLAEFVTDDIF